MRIDAYMQVSQIYQANKTKNATKTGKAGSRDSLEISSFGNAYQVAKQAASQASDVREDKVKEIQAQMAAGQAPGRLAGQQPQPPVFPGKAGGQALPRFPVRAGGENHRLLF